MTDYKLMPVEPTQEMLDRVMGIVTGLSGEYGQFNDYLNEETAREVYEAFRAVAPAAQAEPVYLYRRRGLSDFVTCDLARYEELSEKPDFFETKILYTTPQPAEQQNEVCGYLINDGYKEQFVKTLSEGSRKIAQRFNWVVTAVCRCPDHESEQGDWV